MHKIFKKSLMIVMAVAMVVSLAACGSNQPANTTPATANNTGNSSNQATEAPKAAQPQKDIEYWTVFTGGDGQNMQNIVDAYNATNPIAKVVHRAIDGAELYQKLPLVVQSGVDVPDLVINHRDRLIINEENGVYAPMDEYIAANGKIKAENYLSSAWTAGEIKGKRFAIPLDVHAFITYYNKDLVAKYAPNVLDDGIVTFDEIKASAPAATKDGIYTYSITWAVPQFFGWYGQLGKLTEDGINPTFNNDAAARVLNDWRAAVVDKTCTQDGDDPVALFGQNKLIFLSEGTWMVQRLEEMGVNFGATYSIAYDANYPLTWAGSHQFVLPKNPNLTAERGNAIMDFIAYVGDNSLEWAKAGQAPASLKVINNAEFKAMPQAFLLDKPDLLLLSDYKYYGYAFNAIGEIAWEVPFGRKDAKEALDEAAQKVKDAIANQ